MKKFEITSQSEIETIIRSVDVCCLAMSVSDEPYVIPMNFGYNNGIIYFHSAPTGKKYEILKNNTKVCVSFYANEELYFRNEDVACSYSMKYKSVIAKGEVVFVDNIEEKKRIMNIIMKHYTGKEDYDYNHPAINNVFVFYLKPDEITAYKRGY